MTSTPEPMVTQEPTVIPLVEIPLESTLTPELALTPIPTEAPIEVLTPTPETTDQITTPSDLTTTPKDLL